MLLRWQPTFAFGSANESENCVRNAAGRTCTWPNIRVSAASTFPSWNTEERAGLRTIEILALSFVRSYYAGVGMARRKRQPEGYN